MAGALMDALPGCVSLNTPPHYFPLMQKPLGPMPFCKWTAGDFLWTRQQLLKKEPVGDFRAGDGTALFDGLRDPRRKLSATGEPEPIYFYRDGLKPDFTLVIRHTTLFTAALPALAQFAHFGIIAVIRHPLDVIGSWLRLPQAVPGQGQPPGLERLWPEALAVMDGKADQHTRLVQLYELFLARYHELKDRITLVKYEDLLHDPALAARLIGHKALPAASLNRLESRQPVRNAADAARLREAFRVYGAVTRLYYPDI